MLVNVKRYKLREGLHGVELIQVQSVMLEHTPPGLDHGIRTMNL